jgi:signal transduction histidine kinase
MLVLLASLAWFAPVFVSWQNGPPLGRSLAWAITGFTFPLVAHAALAYPTGRVVSKPARVLVAAIYLEAFATAAVLALFRDPYFDSSCWANCTVNSFLVKSLPSLVHTVEVADRWFVAAAALAVTAVCVVRLIQASRPAQIRLAPILLPTAAFAGAVAARAIALQNLTVEDPYDGALFAIFALASSSLALLALGLFLSVVRERAERGAVAKLVANLGDAPAAGQLQAALSRALHDPQLQIVYWLDAVGSYVDPEGRAVAEPAAAPGQTVTRLVKGERTIALIRHAGAPDELENRIGAAILLGLDNERLQAELLAQLEELRASRTRIVETADRARVALERDLHDGAQQRLLALTYDIRLAGSSAHAETEISAERSLAQATEQAQDAIEELRELAHGIYPAVLAQAGLTAALYALADGASLPVDIDRVDDNRYPSAVESAAYFAAAEAIESAAHRGADHAAVSVFQHDGRLVLTVNDNGGGRNSPMVALSDRVGALGGDVSVGATSCRVEIPCA